MNLSATSAPHSSNEAPAACGGPGGSTLPSPSGETTTVASAQASFPASSPGTTASHSPAQASTPASTPGAAAPHSPAQASFPLTSTASVSTQRAARYGKQLVSHMAHKITGAWDEEAASGYLLFDREGPVLGRFDVIASPSDLRLELRTTPERAAHLEHVAGIHLARFGARDGLTIAWRRSDGSAGTTQAPLTPNEVEAYARERAKKAAREAAGQ
ncbi:DUF2218 domain-containing protein [Actinomyces bouchesdurhonensis]|uniref:DUF2218 domain-containing protein n=1 Tax=Actinomyces bouchesdurhonensis TaxID=1852361 RepID=UPI0023F3B74E|nr:DUF2218 domain-containing protein [Actinomyces bouchesdurhonensis]